MRNRISTRKLNRTPAHRNAMFRNMVDQLVVYERLRTTLAKAKELSKFANGMIRAAKKFSYMGDQRIESFLRTFAAKEKLKTVIAERYKYRTDGYTRVIRAGFRKGDNAPMAIIEFVDRPGELRQSSPTKMPKPVPEQPSIFQNLDNVMTIQNVLSKLEKNNIPAKIAPAYPSPRVVQSSHAEYGLDIENKHVYASFMRVIREMERLIRVSKFHGIPIERIHAVEGRKYPTLHINQLLGAKKFITHELITEFKSFCTPGTEFALLEDDLFLPPGEKPIVNHNEIAKYIKRTGNTKINEDLIQADLKGELRHYLRQNRPDAKTYTDEDAKAEAERVRRNVERRANLKFRMAKVEEIMKRNPQKYKSKALD